MNTDSAHLALSDEVNTAFPGLATPGQMGSTAAVIASPTTAAGAVRWLTDKKREEVYALQFPFELAGVEYREITVRRLSGGEVDVFAAKMRQAPSAENLRLPMYFVGGAEIADAVWDALDDDDVFGLEAAATRLLPARFRRAADTP